MKRIPFLILDAFTDTPFQGNPAGVFLDTEGVLTPEECGMLCDEVHLESAFVSPAPPDSGADFRLRFYTGTTRKATSPDPRDLTVKVIEVPFCGHDTVATTLALAHRGQIAANETVRYETAVGILNVTVSANENGVRSATLHQNPPFFGKTLTGSELFRVADALGCPADALSPGGLPLEVVSTGTPWLLAPVASRAFVDNAPADYGAIAQLSSEYETFGIYVFTIEQSNEQITVWSRCFAPIAGLNEDPVTGSASGTVGCYLAQHGILPVTDTAEAELTAQQGFPGGRGGTARIRVRSQDGQFRVNVTGTAVLVAEGVFQLP